MQNFASRTTIYRVFKIASVLFALLFASTSASAKNCRETSTVVESAESLAKNTAKGGHVSIHVKGKKTEAGKSQFDSEADFTNAFTLWKNDLTKSPKPKNCGGSNEGLMDCVSASKVDISSAVVCNSVDANENCTDTTKITPEKVAFRYAKSAGKWILNTAYPSVNDKCN